MPRKSRNPQLTAGVGLLSRSASYAKSGAWKKKGAWKKVAAPKPAAAAAPKTKTFGKGTRTVTKKAVSYYPADDVPTPLPNHKRQHAPRLRKSLTPGTVLIVLAGRYRGRRVVLLKALPSGLLLITGPYKINGVPLKRVSPAYVVATTTKIDVSKVQFPASVTDKFFVKPKSAKKTVTEAGLFGETQEKKKELNPEKATVQKAVDEAVLASVRAVPFLSRYLKVKFTLRKGQYPHELKF